MFNEYDDVAYNLLVSEIDNGHIGHAYLIDENNNENSFDMVLSFVKKILCSKLDMESTRNICKRIDDENYPELKIIRPDGMFIKKQQILELQKDFSKVAVEGKWRIYIIKDCDKMRPETANSMLKFLEEPESNVVAILMTNNINSILSTIISRCQIIRFGNSNLIKETTEFDQIVLNFIDKMELCGRKAIMYTNELIFEYVNSKDRDGLIKFIDRVIDLYYDILKLSINSDNNNILYYDKLIKYAKISKERLLEKINYLIEARESIKYNVNCNLLIDSLIMNIGG